MTRQLGRTLELPESLSPDLEWMLTSSQASDQALLEQILLEMGVPLAWLARLLSSSDAGAASLLQGALTCCILKRGEYGRGRTPPPTPRAWVMACLLQTAGMASARRCAHTLLPDAPSAAAALAMLVLIAGLSAEECARILKQPLVVTVLPELKSPSPALGGQLASLPSLEDTAPPSDLLIPPAVEAARTRQSRQRRIALSSEMGMLLGAALLVFFIGQVVLRPPPEPTQPPPPTAPPWLRSNFTPFYYRIQPGDTLEKISQRTGVPTGAIAYLNGLSETKRLEPGTYLVLPSSQPDVWTSPPPAASPLPPPPGLSMQSSIAEITTRMEDSLRTWNSLWIDFDIVQYGPEGYFGPPPSVMRKQIWLVQPVFIRVLSGLPDSHSVSSVLVLNGHAYGSSGEYYTDDILPDFDLQTLFDTQHFLTRSGSLTLLGEDQIAGRPALVLEWHNANGRRIYRLWVDSQYGTILRRREYGGSNNSVALVDLVTLRIQYDPQIPDHIFSPRAVERMTQFASGPDGQPEADSSQAALPAQESAGLPPAGAGTSAGTGGTPQPGFPQLTGGLVTGHELLPLKMPPPGFDPSHSRLTFQAPPEFVSGRNRLELFAGEYFLSEVPLDGGSILACRRSPDGSRIAYSVLHGVNDSQSTATYWLDLTQPDTIHQISNNAASAGDFAFAPDGSHLAYYGCAPSGQPCGVYLLDTDTGENQRLLRVEMADYFLWRSDGAELGLLAALGQPNNWRYLVLEIETHEIVYEGDFDWNSLSAAEGSPTLDWQLSYQSIPGVLYGCTLPPVG